MKTNSSIEKINRIKRAISEGRAFLALSWSNNGVRLWTDAPGVGDHRVCEVFSFNEAEGLVSIGTRSIKAGIDDIQIALEG